MDAFLKNHARSILSIQKKNNEAIATFLTIFTLKSLYLNCYRKYTTARYKLGEKKEF